mgnify:FL=1
MSVGGPCSVEGCNRQHMYNSDVCYQCKRGLPVRPRPGRSSGNRTLTSEQIREDAKAGPEPVFLCDDYGVCEYDFILDGRCLHCGALGPPDELEFLTRRQDRFEVVTYAIDMDTSPAEKHALRGVLDALEERDSKLISEEGSLVSPASRIEGLSTSADILEWSGEHLDDPAYAALESGLLEIDSRESPWEEAIQIEAAKGWWLPDDDVEAIRRTMPHSSQCYCDGCLPQRRKEHDNRPGLYDSKTKDELRALLLDRDLSYPHDGFEDENKAELIELLMQDDSRNSLPMLVFTILGVLFMAGFAAAYSPLILLLLAFAVPSYVYAKFTGRGMMAEMFSVKKVGADPDALPEGWHDKPKKEEPGWFGGFDLYFLLGFSAPVLYAIHLVHQNVIGASYITEKNALFYIVTAFVTWPFADDSSEIPYVRVGKGINFATTAIVVASFLLMVLATIAVILLFIYAYSTSPECFGMTQNSDCG